MRSHQKSADFTPGVADALCIVFFFVVALQRSPLASGMVFPAVGASPQDAPPPAVVKEILVRRISAGLGPPYL